MLLRGKGDSILAALILIFDFLLFSVTTMHFFAGKKKEMHSRCLQDYKPQLETCSCSFIVRCYGSKRHS